MSAQQTDHLWFIKVQETISSFELMIVKIVERVLLLQRAVAMGLATLRHNVSVMLASRVLTAVPVLAPTITTPTVQVYSTLHKYC